MVFYFYEEAMGPVCKISVDGLVPNSFHLSHWKGNNTPNALKADTATEIASKYNADPHRASLFPHANIITSNRFHTDGLLAVFTLLHPTQAEPMMPQFIAAAEAASLASFSEEGVQDDLLISGLAEKSSRRLGGIFSAFWRKKEPKEAIYYKEILPLLPDLFKRKDDYRDLWRGPFDDIMASMTLFERGSIGLEECEEERLTIILNDVPVARHAIDAYCKGDLFLVIEDRKKREGGYRYELTYRYYAWADTVRRPAIAKIPMEPLADSLNQLETSSSGRWAAAPQGAQGLRPVSTALLFSDKNGRGAMSALLPETVISSVLSHLRKRKKKG
jgi:hypothetical protein